MTAFTHRLRVRYSECDQQGVVFNGQYLYFYDVALTELWRDRAGPYQQMVDSGVDLMVAEVRIRFVRPARFDELLDITMNLNHLGTTSMIVRPVFSVDDRLVADGLVRHVFVDANTLAKRPMPDYIREALSR